MSGRRRVATPGTDVDGAGANVANQEPNRWTTPVTTAALVAATFASTGSLQDAIVPDSDNSSVQQYVVIAMWFVIAGASYFRRAVLWLDSSVGLAVNMSLYALAIVSISWSDNPLDGAAKAVAMIVVIFCAYRLVKTTPMDEILECVIHGLFLLNGVSIFLCLFVPDVGLLKDSQHFAQWNGIFETKQSLGVAGALLLFLASYRLIEPPRRLYHGVAAATAIACVIGSGSRGGGALAVVAVLCVYLSGVSMRFTRLLAFAPFGMCLVASAIIVYFVLTGSAYLSIFGADLDFTERTFIWQHAISYFKNAPLLGHGLNGFWTIKEVQDIFLERHGWVLPNFHSGYILVFMETGAIGLIIFIAGHLLYGLRIFSMLRSGGALNRDIGVMLVYTCIIFFIDFTETFFLRSTNIVATLLTMGVFVTFSHRAGPGLRNSAPRRDWRAKSAPSFAGDGDTPARRRAPKSRPGARPRLADTNSRIT